MLTPEKFERLSLFGLIIGILGSIYTVISGNPSNLAPYLIAVACTCGSIWGVLKIRDRKDPTATQPSIKKAQSEDLSVALNKKDDSTPIVDQEKKIGDILELSDNNDGSKDFENISTRMIINIAENGTDATFNLSRRVKCKVQSANEYYYRYAPIEKFPSFIHSPGVLEIEDVCGGADITAILDRPYDYDEELDIRLIGQGVDVFHNRIKDYWLVNKFYSGPDATHVEIFFPKGVELSRCKADIVANENWKSGRPLKKASKKDFRDGRIVLVVQTRENELKVSEKLRITWHYKLVEQEHLPLS